MVKNVPYFCIVATCDVIRKQSEQQDVSSWRPMKILANSLQVDGYLVVSLPRTAESRSQQVKSRSKGPFFLSAWFLYPTQNHQNSTYSSPR